MKITRKHLIATAASLGVLALPAAALALSFETDFAGSIGFTSTDLKQTVLNVISFVLGLLGLIAVIMILYGGFIWLTAGGNEDKVGSAKKIISAAIVGLIVVLLAWAIVNFVIKSTVQVTS
ncbi:hypothetical protein C4546_02415 [Candidatus Parcubacteria bacterium]|jgi:hypothetical protein|nr:MAG: hypothetical protein C4546_02415 [Candidatus Parcubacteria bacterium]